MPSVKVDLSALKQLGKSLKEADSKNLQVGWFESAKYDDNTPVAAIAAQNEFGNPKLSIPARPFIRPTVAEKQSHWEASMAALAERVVNGSMSMDDALHSLGLLVSGHIKTAISQTSSPPLSPITIALRKHRNEGVKIGGRFVGAVAAAIEAGETGAGQLGDQSFGNKDPLRDSGYMIASLTHEVT
ncbi:conserved hypothetical protein [Vibrio chagasii]|nr:conserved hypothetical protein [Vibrio chagasii]